MLPHQFHCPAVWRTSANRAANSLQCFAHQGGIPAAALIQGGWRQCRHIGHGLGGFITATMVKSSCSWRTTRERISATTLIPLPSTSCRCSSRWPETSPVHPRGWAAENITWSTQRHGVAARIAAGARICHLVEQLEDGAAASVARKSWPCPGRHEHGHTELV